MPIYEYVCKACGHEFEREQRISEDPVKKCPSCGAQKARRLISRTSFVLKGGGWYSDLYAAPQAKSGSEESTKPAADGGDTKPAAADDAKPAPAAKSDAGTKGDSPGKPPKKGGKGAKAAAA